MKYIARKTLAILLSVVMMITPVSMTVYAASESKMKSTLLSIAENEVGYTGTGSYSKYGEWYGYQGAWCTTFVLWCYYQTGVKLDVKLYGKIVPSGGNCNSMISWYQNKGRYHTRSSGYTPKKGDLIFFDWSGNGSSQHVGLVHYVSGSTIHTIEGNCSGKVKAKSYTPSGSKPYASTSSIMGYGSPNWDAVSDGKGEKETRQTTKKATTTKKSTTKKSKKSTKKKSATKKSSKKKTTKKSTTKKASTGQSTTKKDTTTKPTATKKQKAVAKSMDIYAATTELEIGDSVSLNYTIKPKGAQAVVGYFCDEENVIEISQGGVITATGEGKATVVVCANDEIYRQCDFTVTEASAKVTRHTPNIIEPDTTEPLRDKTLNQKLSDIGINAEKLMQHAENFIYPAAIIGATAVLAGIIGIVKTIASAIRKKKEEKE